MGRVPRPPGEGAGLPWKDGCVTRAEVRFHQPVAGAPLRRVLKILLLAVLLTGVRYAIGYPLEIFLIQDKLRAVMSTDSDLFHVEFSPLEQVYSMAYNFLGWLMITVIYVKIEPLVHGHPIRRSLKVYAVMYMYFVSVSAIYMLRYARPTDFYIYFMLDRLLLFPLLAVANGILHPWLFRSHVPAHPAMPQYLPGRAAHPGPPADHRQRE
jgi:hypothetical protein